MSVGPVLDILIGLSFLFFLVAVATSALVEWVANLLKKRPKYLLRGLRDLLAPLAQQSSSRISVQAEKSLYKSILKPSSALTPEPKTLTPDLVMQHALVAPLLTRNGAGGITGLPSYIPGKTVAVVIVDLIDRLTKKSPRDELVDAVQELEDGPFKQALLALAKQTSGEVDRFTREIEQWYDAQMQRVSGAYRRWAKRWAGVVGIVVALLLHVDVIGVAESLWRDQPVREAVVAAATNDTLCAADADVADKQKCVQTELASLEAAHLSIGPQAWTQELEDGDPILLVLFGCILTGLFSMVGAPFWFSVLNRLGTFRNDARAGEEPT